jgi:hypothetical protein
MSYRRSVSRPRQRPLTGLLIGLTVLQTTGCTSWRPVYQPLPASVESRSGHRLRFHLKNGTSLVADSARVTDSLVVVFHRRSAAAPSMTDTLMLVDLAGVEERKHSTRKTVGLIVGILSVVYVVALAIAWDSFESNLSSAF